MATIPVLLLRPGAAPALAPLAKSHPVLFPGPVSRAQAEVGNYRKRRIAWAGLTLVVENEPGTVRQGDGWFTRMVLPYGEVEDSEGCDGDRVDVFIGPDLETAQFVYVVHQRRYGRWSEFDEDKCMVGFLSEESAAVAYLQHYDDPRFLGSITTLAVPEFVAKVRATRDNPQMIKSNWFGGADLLKATLKKTVQIPGFYKKDGQWVPPHTRTVHYNPDHSFHDIAHGGVSHSQKQAHAKLSKESWFHDLPVDDKALHVMAHATDIQDAASASAAVSGWKAAALAGKNPSGSQWAAFNALSKLKQAPLWDAVDAKVGNWKHLVQPIADDKPEPVAPALEPAKLAPELGASMKATIDGYDLATLKEVVAVHAPGAPSASAAVHAYASGKLAGKQAADNDPSNPGSKAWTAGLKDEADKAHAASDYIGLEALADEGVHGSPEVALHAGVHLANLKGKDAIEALPKTGSFYQKEALNKLKGDASWQALSHGEQHAAVLALYKQLQGAASASAAVSLWKKSLLAGKQPSASQHAAYMALFKQDSKKALVLGILIAKQIGLEKYNALVGQADAAAKVGAPAAPSPAPAKSIAEQMGAKVTPIPDPFNKPAPVKTPRAGPKEGDTKPGADGGTLVLKNGVWVKQGVPADPGQKWTGPKLPEDWSYTKEDPGLSGASSLTIDLPDGTMAYAALSGDGGVQVGFISVEDDGNANEHEDFADASGASQWLQNNIPGDSVGALTEAHVAHLLEKNPPAAAAAPAKPARVASVKPVVPPAVLQTSVAATVYHNKTAGHFKQWSVSVLGSQMKTSYGKIGAKQTPTVKQFASPAAAAKAKMNLVAEKLKTGYLLAPTTKATHVHASAAPADAPAPAAPAAAPAQPSAAMVQGLSPAAANALVVGLPMPPAFLNKQSVDKAIKAAIAGDLPLLKDLAAKYTKAGSPKTAKIMATLLQAMYSQPSVKGAVPFAPSKPAPGEPMGLAGFQIAASKISIAVSANNGDAVVAEVKLLNGLKAPGAQKAYLYGVAVLKHMGASQPSFIDAADWAGPKEGDIKQGADGLLVLKDGHWQKMFTPSMTAKEAKAVMDVDGSPVVSLSANGQAFINTATAAAAKGDLAGVAAALKAAIDYGKVFKSVKKIEALHSALQAKFAAQGIVLPKGAAKNAAPVGVPSPAAKPSTAQPVKSTMPGIPGGTAAPKIVSVQQLLAASATDVSNWKKVGGQEGSNEGGYYVDGNGDKWYCKFPKNADHASSEILASKLYAAAGVAVPELKSVSLNGKPGIASRVVDVKKDASALPTAPGMRQGFAVDAWLANWDVVGPDNTNTQLLKGKALRVDVGGALEHRAQGAKKTDFGATVLELDSLRDAAKNPSAAKVFSGMTDAEMAESARGVFALSDASIEKMVMAFGPGTIADKNKLAATLLARKADLAKRFPAVAKEYAAKVQVIIPAAPNFKEWEGPGKGLSSSPHLNQSNQDAANAIYQKGLNGEVKELKEMTYQPVNKDTGAATGALTPITAHPSQHVKKYHGDVVKAATTPIVAPSPLVKDAQIDLAGGSDGGVFAVLMKAFDDIKGMAAATHKLGRYAILGRVQGGGLFDAWKPKEKSQKNGAISAKKLYDQSNANFAALSQVEREAIKSYTGSGYQTMNNASTGVGAHGKTDYAIGGLNKASVELEEGTVLSRKFSFKTDAAESLKSLLGSEGSVLKDFGIISTSLRPSCWSGSVHLRITCAKGSKGLYVAPNPSGGGGAISTCPGEDEVILPYGTKFFVTKVHPAGTEFTDQHGSWGTGGPVVDVIALPPDA